MEASLRFYVDLLGFKNVSWGDGNFTSVNRGGAGIYLCRVRCGGVVADGTGLDPTDLPSPV